jgi:hypothetical protein
VSALANVIQNKINDSLIESINPYSQVKKERPNINFLSDVENLFRLKSFQ